MRSEITFLFFLCFFFVLFLFLFCFVLFFCFLVGLRFYCSVLGSFCSLTKGITPKMCRFCVCVIINKRSFEPFMCLDLISGFDVPTVVVVPHRGIRRTTHNLALVPNTKLISPQPLLRCQSDDLFGNHWQP